MIFATVGTQLPFPRLVNALDEIAPDLWDPVFVQTHSSGRWTRIESADLLIEEVFEQKCAAARCIVGHAGIGTYLTACRHGKPAILMPRRRSLKEHRTDHQIDTAAALAERDGVEIVHTAEDLKTALLQDLKPARHAPEGYETLLSELAEIAG